MPWRSAPEESVCSPRSLENIPASAIPMLGIVAVTLFADLLIMRVLDDIRDRTTTGLQTHNAPWRPEQFRFGTCPLSPPYA